MFKVIFHTCAKRPVIKKPCIDKIVCIQIYLNEEFPGTDEHILLSCSCGLYLVN